MKKSKCFKFKFKNRDILELAKLIITLSKTKNDYILLRDNLKKTEREKIKKIIKKFQNSK